MCKSKSQKLARILATDNENFARGEETIRFHPPKITSPVLRISLGIVLRLAIIVALFWLCYHLDAIVDRVFTPAAFIMEREIDENRSWWELAYWFDVAYDYGRDMFLAGLQRFLKWLALLASKIFWPFVFAAIAVPIALPRPFRLRNWWSFMLAGVFTLIFLLQAGELKEQILLLWQTLKSMKFAEVKNYTPIFAKLEWAVVSLAIALTLLYTLTYRLLHQIKMEQLLYFVVLSLNVLYILLLDPIAGEVDDVIGLILTAFLSLSIWLDRLLTRPSKQPADLAQHDL